MKNTTIIIIVVVIFVLVALLIGLGIGIWYFFFRTNTSSNISTPVGSLVKVSGPYKSDNTPETVSTLGGNLAVANYCNNKVYGKYGYRVAKVESDSLSRTSTQVSNIVWLDEKLLIWDNDAKPLGDKIGYKFKIPIQTDGSLKDGDKTLVYYLVVRKGGIDTYSTAEIAVVGVSSTIKSGTSNIILSEDFELNTKPSICT